MSLGASDRRRRPAVAAPHSAEGHRRRAASSRAVLLGCVGVFVAYLQVGVVPTALSQIGSALHSSTSDLQWVVDAYIVPMAAFVLTAGTLGDLFGRRRLFLAGLALLAAGGAIALGAQEVTMLWVGQAICGIGAAALLPTTLTVVSVAVPDPHKRGAAIGAWAASLGLGIAVGPLVSGLILTSADWRWIFLPIIPAALLAFVAVWRWLPGSKAGEGRHLDIPGQLCAVIAIVAVVLGVIEGPTYGWDTPLVIASFCVAAAAAVGFIVVERRSTSPMLRLDLFGSPAFAATSIVATLAFFGLIGVIFLLSLFFGQVQQLSALDIALRFLVMSGLIVALGPLAARLTTQLGPRIVMTSGLVTASVGMLSLARFEALDGFGTVWWSFVLLGIGFALVLTAMSQAAIASVSPQLAGMASAANNALRQTGGALGPAVLGAIFTSHAITELPVALSAAQVPAATSHQVIGAVNTGGFGAAAHAAAGPHAAQVHGALGNALSHGMHAGVIVGGIALLVAAGLTLIVLRGKS